MADTGTTKRGFASMDPVKQREIASKGGKAAHEKGRAHEFTSEEAREAGRKGGQAVSRNRAHMAEIGRQGGLHRAGKALKSITNVVSPPIEGANQPSDKPLPPPPLQVVTELEKKSA